MSINEQNFRFFLLAITHSELIVKTNDNDHVDEITEECRCVNIAKVRFLRTLPTEFDDRVK